MTLTVPRAAVIAGAAPSLKVDTPQTGNMIAGLGERMFQIGMQLEDDRLDREAKRLQVDMTRDLGQLRTEFDHMGDPDDIDTLWGPRVTELKDQYLQKADPKNAERVGLIIDDLSERHTFAVGRRSLGLRDSQRLAIWDDYRAVAAQQAVLVDDGTRDMLYQQFDAETDDLARRGIISPQQAAERRRDFRTEVQNTRIIDQVASDPEGFLTAADAGSYSHLPPEQMARYRVQADAKIAAREALLIKQADLDLKAQNTLIAKRLTAITDIANADRTAIDETFMSLPEVQGHPDYPKAMAAISLREERADLPFMTPAQRAEMIASEEQKSIDQPWQKERLVVLRDYDAAARKDWGHDAMGAAIKGGFRMAELPDLATADVEDIASAIQMRIANAEGLHQGGFTEQVPDPVTLDERAAMKEALAVDADPARRADLATALVGAGASKLIDDPVARHVGALLTMGGNDALGRSILRGQQVLEHGNIVPPSKAETLAPTFDQIGPLFADMLGGEEEQAIILNATDALYASRVRASDPTGKIDETAYKQALHEVMGGTGTAGKVDATGGVASINHRLTILPMGVTARSVEQSKTALFRDLDGVGGTGGPTADPAARMKRGTESLRQISISGGMPTLGGEVIDASDWSDAEFVAIGDDTYQLVVPVADVDLVALDSETGQPFVFSLSRLTARYGR